VSCVKEGSYPLALARRNNIAKGIKRKGTVPNTKAENLSREIIIHDKMRVSLSLRLGRRRPITNSGLIIFFVHYIATADANKKVIDVVVYSQKYLPNSSKYHLTYRLMMFMYSKQWWSSVQSQGATAPSPLLFFTEGFFMEGFR
jgi:hypothetical protein